MSTALALQPSRVTPADRLSLTFCLALLLHALLVMGVAFRPEDPVAPQVESLEVILVQRSSPEPVEDVTHLANANQEGGGERQEDTRPAVPLAAPFVAPTPEVIAAPPAPQPEAQSAPEALVETPKAQPEPEPETRAPAPVLTAETGKPEPVPAPQPEAPAPKASAKAEPEQKAAPAAPPVPAVTELAEQPSPSAAALIASSFQMATLDAELAARVEASAQRPRRKFISANSREYKYAAYMEAWRAKVERIGNLNYPDEARRKKLAGSLILDVALNSDGSVAEITIRKPSGYPVLDDAAVRIVKLSAPFAPFPEGFRDEVDVLHITRTWQFLNTNRFAGK